MAGTSTGCSRSAAPRPSGDGLRDGDRAGVDKIVGAGGLFITLAKRQVIGAVGIDGSARPKRW